MDSEQPKPRTSSKEAVKEIWRSETPVHLMSYGIHVLLKERLRIQVTRFRVESVMNKILDEAQASPEAVHMQKLWLWREDIVQKALARLAELEISEEDRALLRQAITGQVEEGQAPAIDPNTVYPDVLTTEPKGATDGNIVDHRGGSAG